MSCQQNGRYDPSNQLKNDDKDKEKEKQPGVDLWNELDHYQSSVPTILCTAKLARVEWAVSEFLNLKQLQKT